MGIDFVEIKCDLVLKNRMMIWLKHLVADPVFDWLFIQFAWGAVYFTNLLSL